VNIERDKFLTEKMGQCWHNHSIIAGGFVVNPFDHGKGPTRICDKCGQDWSSFTVYDRFGRVNPDLSTWPGFGLLWEWAQKQEWFTKFKYFYIGGATEVFMKLGESIHPDKFADALYEYLKEVRP